MAEQVRYVHWRKWQGLSIGRRAEEVWRRQKEYDETKRDRGAASGRCTSAGDTTEIMKSVVPGKCLAQAYLSLKTLGCSLFSGFQAFARRIWGLDAHEADAFAVAPSEVVCSARKTQKLTLGIVGPVSPIVSRLRRCCVS
jgi:hypothetical protein